MSRRLDQAIGGDAFFVDESACYQAAQELRRYQVSPSAVTADVRPEAQALFKLFFVAICHSMNWDFLLGRMREKFFSDDPQAMIKSALNCKARDVEDLLSGYARTERIQAKERAKILRDVGATIVEHYDSDITRLFFPSKIQGSDGFLARLAVFNAFSEDPASKKANVFVQELLREKIASFEDEASVQPAIDYHLIRLYLRTGRVIPREEIIVDELSSGSPTRMRLVNLLRKKVGEALALTAFYAQKTVFEVNYVEWQIARQRCDYDRVICTGKWPDSNFDLDVIAIQPSGCPYAGWCLAHTNPEWRALKEPPIRKAFY